MLGCTDTSKQIPKPKSRCFNALMFWFVNTTCQQQVAALHLHCKGRAASGWWFALWPHPSFEPAAAVRAREPRRGTASLSPAPVCLVIRRQEKSRQIPAFQEALRQEEEKRARIRLRGSQTEAQPLLRQRLQRHLLLRWRAERWFEVSACESCSPCFSWNETQILPLPRGSELYAAFCEACACLSLLRTWHPLL